MEIKIHDKNTRIDECNFKKSNNVSSTSFSNVFNQVALKSKATDDTKMEEMNILKDALKTGNSLIDNLPDKEKSDVLDSIDHLNGIFDIDMLGNPGQFFKKDSTINITRILGLYGKNVSSSELTDLGKQINTLKDNGLISDEDYFAALKWIATKQEAFRVQMKSEENKAYISDLMWKPTEN